MERVLKLVLVCLVLGSVILTSSFAAISKSPQFVLEKIKMKLGDTTALRSLINGDIELKLEGFDSSNPEVAEITPKGYLKAMSTGASTLTYTYEDKTGKTVVLKTHIEVTRYDATYDVVGGGTSKEDIFLTLQTGEGSIKLKSSAGAIPDFPEVSKPGYVFGGWYMEPTYQTKVTEKQRFSKDTTLYAKWLTEAEVAATSTSNSELYDDINGHWGRVAIDAVSYKGLFQGVAERTFGPEIPMTRAMAVAVLGRLEGVDVKDLHSKISDVSETAYYDGYLAWAIENKIVEDVKDDKFRPNDVITREEIAIYIANYMDYKKYKVSDLFSASFGDITDLPIASKLAIEKLYNAGIMQGVGGNSFAPANSTTRAQMAQIFYNLYNFMMKYKG